MRFREHILLLRFAKRSKWTHGTDLIHWFIAVRRQNVRREDILNVAIDASAIAREIPGARTRACRL
jgi:hypothetical protein